MKLNSQQVLNIGFTLIELLVVISIIGVLAGLIVPNLVGMRERAQDAKKKADLSEMKKALRLYYNDHQYYPEPSDVTTYDEDNPQPLEIDDVIYMKKVPVYEQYVRTGDYDDFAISVTLANSSDSDIADSQARCAPITFSLIDPGANDFIICSD